MYSALLSVLQPSTSFPSTIGGSGHSPQCLGTLSQWWVAEIHVSLPMSVHLVVVVELDPLASAYISRTGRWPINVSDVLCRLLLVLLLQYRTVGANLWLLRFASARQLPDGAVECISPVTDPVRQRFRWVQWVKLVQPMSWTHNHLYVRRWYE